MSKLTTRQRDALPDSAFALPNRKYLIIDKNHARAALGRASEGKDKGWLTNNEYELIVTKAKEVLGES